MSGFFVDAALGLLGWVALDAVLLGGLMWLHRDDELVYKFDADDECRLCVQADWEAHLASLPVPVVDREREVQQLERIWADS